MSAQDVMERLLTGVGMERAATVSGADFETRQLVSEINASGRDLVIRAEWSKLYVTTTVPAGTTSLPLPADFREMAESGAIVMASGPVRAVVMPEQWAFLSQNPSAQTYYHIKGGNVLFSPALPLDAQMTYLSGNWVAGGKSSVTDDGDELLVPENLVALGAVWRWKRAKGLPYDDHLAEYEADLEAYLKADRGA